MRQYLQELKNFFRKGDLVLLLLCLITTTYGVIMISTATNYRGNLRYIIIQIAAAALGVMMYILVSSFDVDFFSEHRTSLVVFNSFVLLLLIPMIFILPNFFADKAFAVFLAEPVSDVIAAAVTTFMFFRFFFKMLKENAAEQS